MESVKSGVFNSLTLTVAIWVQLSWKASCARPG